MRLAEGGLRLDTGSVARFAFRKNMRSSAKRFLLVYGAIAFAAAINACANGNNNEGYTPPAPTTPQNNSSPDATTSSGDDGATTITGDDGGTGSTDDGSTGGEAGDDGGADAATEDADDGGEEAGPGPCAVGQTCVDLAPAGWSGYVQLRIAIADAGTGACAAPYAAVQQAGVADPSGAAAECTTCTCGAPSPAVTCVSGVTSANLGCSGSDTQNALTPGTCTNVIFPNGGTAPATASNTSSCTKAGGQLVGALDAAVAVSAIVCSPGAGDAGAASAGDAGDAGDAAAGDAGAGVPPTCDPLNQACASPISSQAGPSGVCIYQSGITTCPAGTHFTEQHIVGASVTDTRACGCACGPASCPTDGYIEGFANNGCTGTPAATLDAGAACVPIGTTNPTNGSTHFKYVQSRSGASGSCAVVDGGPSGGVSVDNGTALTLCCIP